MLIEPTFLVVDCDVDSTGASAGVDQLAALYKEHGETPPPPTVRTGKGGAHFWYRAPAGVPLACNRKLASFVDTRTARQDAHGDPVVGQVVVPPSLHQSGKRYEWVDGIPSSAGLLYIAPTWMIERLRWKTPEATDTTPEAVTTDAPPSENGWDGVTRTYWTKACAGLAGQQPGGNGQQGRNTRLFSLGADARRLANTSSRTTPGQDAMRADAIAAAMTAGLPDEGLGAAV